MLLDLPEVQAIDAEASGWMKRGIGLLARGGDAAGALICFDRALELRSRLPFETEPRLRFGLAACWLNRADAIMRLQDAAQIPVAIDAFDEALVLLRDLPLDEDPRFARRLAIAHQNRGLALRVHEGSAAAETAIAAFTDALAILDSVQGSAIPDRDYLRAAVWTNLAQARRLEEMPGSMALSRDAAHLAIALVANRESDDVDAAEVGLKARHLLCQLAAAHLSEVVDEAMADEVHDATDLVDDGLGLVRQWERKGVSRFRGIACDLFRFGARLFAAFQPHFLHEFVEENLDPGLSSQAYVESAGMRAVAAEIFPAAAPRAGDGL